MKDGDVLFRAVAGGAQAIHNLLVATSAVRGALRADPAEPRRPEAGAAAASIAWWPSC